MSNTAKKITLATLKSFVRKATAAGNLHIRRRTYFDGMTDGIQATENPQFVKVSAAEMPCSHNLGLQGIWLVLGGRDSFVGFEKNGFRGIEVYNSCGRFEVAVPVA